MKDSAKYSVIARPLFWDLHLHGVGGIDFMDHSLDETAMTFCCETLGSRGIEFFTPTLLSASSDALAFSCQTWGAFITKLCRGQLRLSSTAALPLGLHLEGPFLSPQMAGAHLLSDLRLPSLTELKTLWNLSQGQIAILTLAPELIGSERLIKWATAQKIRVQLGHTQASSKQALKAQRAGACGVTHLFNAMPFHHRQPGLWAALMNPLMNHPKRPSRAPHEEPFTAEVITDGIHVAATTIVMAQGILGPRLYGVSDGCSAVGLTARKGQHSQSPLALGPLTIEIRNSAAYVAQTNTLAGGATFITAHPERLLKALRGEGYWGPSEKPPLKLISALLDLFRPLQTSNLNRREHQILRGCRANPSGAQRKLRFHRETLKLLGCS